jgi:hypothetical protein
MITVLSYFPGNKVTLFLEVVDGYGRVNSITTPQIDGILLPTFTAAPGYPQPMSQLDIGLYYYQFVLPQGASAVGSYLVEASYTYQDGYVNSQLYQIVVLAPFGNFSTTVVG